MIFCEKMLFILIINILYPHNFSLKRFVLLMLHPANPPHKGNYVLNLSNVMKKTVPTFSSD